MPEIQSAGEAAPATPSFQQQVEAAEQQGLSPNEPLNQAREEMAKEPPGDTAQAEAADKVEKVVPLPALHEERQKRKQAQAELDQMRAQFTQLQQQQIAMMQWAQQQNRAAAPPPPDPAVDPLGAQMHEIQQLKGQLGQLTQAQQAAQQQEYARRAQEWVVQNARLADAQFTQSQPDAPQAIAFLKASKAAQYEAVGMTEQAAWNRVMQDEFELCASALQRGENPAEVAYNIAKASGYTPAEKKLEMQKSGQRAAGPSGGNGGQGGGRLSLDSLLKLKGDDFLKATEGDKWRKLAGG